MTMLSETEIRVLHEPLDDEYQAWATCDQSTAEIENGALL
jgi:hypothetical protein